MTALRTFPPTSRTALLVPAVGAGRVAVGAALLVRPRLLTGLLRSAPAPEYALQMLGAREVVLGVGALVGVPQRPWALAGLAADAVDAVVLARATGSGRVDGGRGLAVVLVAVGAAAAAAAGLAGGRTR